MESENSYLLNGHDNDHRSVENKVQQISFSDLSYSVPQKRHLCFPAKPKPVLESVSGIFQTGLNAILGPTGSGKTSLMDLLAGRISRRRFNGDIRVDGHPQPDHFRFMVGYVVQQDFLEGVLTVRENIQFSASLRLSRQSLSRGDVKKRVQEVIDKLGLNEVAGSIIGTEFSRGVSSGERKRTNIATELVIAPSILFLDEPTSGLDAFTALSLLYQLESLSKEGRLIVVTLHQPRYAILQLLDRVTLLSAGESVYHGEWSSVIPYFSELGYRCEGQENPGDFLLDMIANESLFTNKQCNSHRNNQIELEGEERLSCQFKASHQHEELCSQLERTNRTRADLPSAKSHKYATNRLWQFLTIVQRSSRIVSRSPIAYLTHTMLSSLGYMLFGVVLFQTPLTPVGLRNRSGLLTLILVHHFFGLAGGNRSMHERKQQFIHEHKQGYYCTLPYIFGKMLPEFFASKISSSLVPSTLIYLLLGFKRSLVNYLLYILTLQLVIYSASGVSMFFSAVTNNLYLTIILPEFTFMLMYVIGGNFNYNLIPFPSEVLKYFSLFRLSAKTLLINELTGLEFCTDAIRNLTGNGTCYRETYPVYESITVSSFIRGEEYLDSQLIMYGSAWDLWNGPVGLVLYSILFYALTYFALRFAVRKK